MKTGIYFNAGATILTNGQKSSVVNAEPEFIANSTNGKFTITSPVSKALDIAPGEKVMIVDDASAVQAAIDARADVVVKYAEEHDIDINSYDGQQAIIEAFHHYYIAKGILKFKRNGEPILTTIRMSNEDKKKYIETNKEALVEANREILISRNGGEDADVDTLIGYLDVEEVEFPKVQDAEGSLASTTSNATGIGCILSFTDSATWNHIKRDLDNKNSKNRVFSVDLTNPLEGKANNGYEMVTYKMFPVEFKEDRDVISRNAKSEE